MKIRTGFVSNSSSSSFIVTYDPQRITLDKAFFEALLSEKQTVTGWLKKILDNMSQTLVDAVKHGDKISSMEEAIEEFGGEEFVPEECKKALAKGWKVISGGLSDDGGGIYEIVLCHALDGEFQGDSFTFSKTAGY